MPPTLTLSTRQAKALRFIADYQNGVQAWDIGMHLKPDATGRSASATGSQIVWWLIRKGLVERRLVHRELYSYHILAAGRAFLKAEAA